MPLLEGAWNCAQCPTVNIRGMLKHCPTCGDPRMEGLDPSEAYYLPTDVRVITDPEAVRRAGLGPVWNCGHCGEPHDGDVSVCTTCKRPRDADDFVSPVTRYVSGVDAQDATLSDASQLETDWVDATLQRYDKLQVLEEDPVVQPVRTLLEKYLPRVGKPQYASNPVAGNAATAASIVLLNRLKTPRNLLIISLVLVFGMIVFGARSVYVNYFATETVSLTVTDLSWERKVEVEEFRTLTLQDWSVPSDGRVLSSSREIRSYRKVLDRYVTKTRQVPVTTQTGTRMESYACGSTTVNNGNGTFTSSTTYCSRPVPVFTTTYHDETYQDPVYRQEPVYDTKYTYQVDRWMTDHFDSADGETNPYWPEPTLESSKQRVGDQRDASYEVVVVDAQGREFEREIDESIWNRVDEGMMLEGEQTRKGSLREIDWQLAG